MKVDNPFKETYSDQRDLELISLALNGDRVSLSDLIKRNHQYIFNVALKMVNNVPDAEDITQEILVKIVTNLSKYDSTKGKFRTWLYRITFNHFLNLKKATLRKSSNEFRCFFDFIEGSEVIELTDHEEKELQESIEESKLACMAGMLMCLDREQRLVYIVGEIFEINHNIASDFFETSPDNFRQKLSRARKDLHSWMHNRCGLVNDNNPCRCPKKTKGFITNGWVNPSNLKWNSNYKQKIADLTEQKIESTLLTIDDLYARLYKNHPFKISSKTENIVNEIINDDNLQKNFNL